MGYKDNPFNSTKGKGLLKDIFNLMFVGKEGKPSQIEQTDKIRQVNHYRGNIVNIVNKMRKFVTGYQQVTLAESNSSGILVCPSCKRRDAIWMWETVDAGHYASANDWLSSVALTKWNQGTAHEKGRYCFVVRYRCNDVTTCDKCHTTVAGHYDSCPSCNSNSVSKVGCGEESFATHFIREYTADQNFPQTWTERDTTGNSKVQDPKNRRLKLNGRISGYDFKHTQVPNGKILKNWSEIKNYLPYIEFTYTHQGTGASSKMLYPVSQLNYAMSKQNFVQCVAGKVQPGGGNYHAQASYPLADAYNDPLEECPECDSSDFGPLQEVKGKYYRPHPMKIVNEQPLAGSTASGGTFKGQPVYTIYLESPVSDSFKLLLPVAQQLNLRPIPNNAEISQITSGSTACQNDVGGIESENQAIQEANEKMVEDQKKKMEDDAKLAGDGFTNKGFTYDVCEGRSKKAYYDFNISKWVDDSPNCISYREDGTTLTKKREYARWTQIPDYSPKALPGTYFNEYLGPNPQTHLIMDWIKANQALGVYVASPVNYHTTVKIADRIDEDAMIIYEVYECKTCRAIVEAGGIINWRKSIGDCDENGKVISDFPQEVLDKEIAYEKSFPTKNNEGDPVPTAWGLVADSEHNGKKMLENPNINIRIG
tara:strand:+ start:4640 stop:6592 length:1953 start_codon:yes stop_codon:yes gene_type:complete